MNKTLPLVVIGSGGAAVHALQAAREYGNKGEIHLFTDSFEPPYNPMLTTYYLAGKLTREKCYPFGQDFEVYKRLGVIVQGGSSVREIDAKAKIVTNAAGVKTHYQACLIASGASAIVPTIPGMSSSRVYSFRSMQDAERLREACLKRPKRVLIVGASMVGMRLVEIFQEAGTEVYLVDLAPHIFPLAAYPECAERIEERLLKKGIKLILQAKVVGLQEIEQGLKVHLGISNPGTNSSGENTQEVKTGASTELNVDLAVFCVGVKSNLDFIKSSEVAIDKGIVVDEYMQTSAASLYAAGDVVQATNLLNQQKGVISLWANACQQGRVAGANMAGIKIRYPGSIPQNITHFFDSFFVSIGNTCGQEQLYKLSESNYDLFVFLNQGKIVGVNLLTRDTPDLLQAIGVFRHQVIRAITQAPLNSFPGGRGLPRPLWDILNPILPTRNGGIKLG